MDVDLIAIADIDLPRKISEVGTIRKIFLDPTASHLLITTTHGENFYLHSRSTKARHLSRLKSLHIECVAWSPALPTTSTREILIGTQDGSIYETYIEGMEENFMRKDDRYLKQVYKMPDNNGVTGLWVDTLPGKPELRRVVVSTAGQIMHWVGRVQRHSDVGSIFSKFFEAEAPSTFFLQPLPIAAKLILCSDSGFPRYLNSSQHPLYLPRIDG